ncbi:sugar-binding transcriptional regulator [Anaerotignum propionicum]|uniref:sugar-binding transcriptional regulator n=1 Tax=Anaerotignum propionicum TaxID=28446 RepID=UPI00289E4407|nr:sugar-binding domain-containing protein [Anaerotignum propionicum]
MEDKLQLIRKIAPDLTEEMIKRYRVLKTVRLLQPCGRRMVVLALGMTERTVRSEIERFSVQKLVQVSKTGMVVTEEGLEVLEGLDTVFSIMTGLSVLEEKLALLLGVKRVLIAQGDADVSERSRKEMGQLAMRHLLEKTNEKSCIAITGGSSMEDLVLAAPEMSKPMAKMVVPARGSIGRRMELQADTLAVQLAEKLQAEYRLLHLPDNLSETALEEMKKQPEIFETIQEMDRANILLLGVGNALDMAEKRRLDEEIMANLVKQDAIAEACGYYFNRSGEVLYRTRSIAIDFDQISKMDEVIVVAGGEKKAESILAVSKSIPSGIFITDEGAAMKMLRILEA